MGLGCEDIFWQKETRFFEKKWKDSYIKKLFYVSLPVCFHSILHKISVGKTRNAAKSWLHCTCKIIAERVAIRAYRGEAKKFIFFIEWSHYSLITDQFRHLFFF